MDLENEKQAMANPSSSRRIVAEVTKLATLAEKPDGSGEKFVIDKSPVDGSTTDAIIGRIYPKSEPYNAYSYEVEIKFTQEYPFKPPEIRFLKPFYHPNVNEKGEICLALLNQGGTYRPTTTIVDIVKVILNIVDNPDVEHTLIPGTENILLLFFIISTSHCFRNRA